MHCWTNNEEINVYLEKVVGCRSAFEHVYIGNSQLDQNSILRSAHVDRYSLTKLVELRAIGMNK